MFIRFKQAHWRLKAYVVENTRRDGKVRQEIIAHLGSIDSRNLGLMPDEDRQRSSIAARARFWETANPKLKLLANRAGGDDGVKRLRMAVHARIPWPMEPERSRLAALTAVAEAEHEIKGYERLYGWNKDRIARNDKEIARLTEDNRALRQKALSQIGQVNMWQAQLQERRKRAVNASGD